MTRQCALLTILCAVFVFGPAACASLYDDDYSIGDLDDYQIVEKGYDYEDEFSDKSWFNPYTGDYDDPYGDSALDNIVTAETDDCQVAADGKATFSGMLARAPLSDKLEVWCLQF